MRWSSVVRHSILLLAVVGAVVVVFARPRLPQPSEYHLFADHRSFLGIPNCLNVLSNLLFAIVGLSGLARALGHDSSRKRPFPDPWVRWPYAALFAGVVLTSVGSGYYHLAPDNSRLVWDRLPMSVGFMGLLTGLLAERVSVSVSQWLFGPLLALGATSVAYWYWSELHGCGDLRLYVLVQFGSVILVVLLLALYRAQCLGTGYVVAAVVAYAVAKGLELADRQIFALGHAVSGHTLKHLAAAGGVASLVAMLRARSRWSIALAYRPANKALQTDRPSAGG